MKKWAVLILIVSLVGAIFLSGCTQPVDPAYQQTQDRITVLEGKAIYLQNRVNELNITDSDICVRVLEDAYSFCKHECLVDCPSGNCPICFNQCERQLKLIVGTGGNIDYAKSCETSYIFSSE